MSLERLPPWKRPKPGTARKGKRLSAPQIEAARARAAAAGRRYPNLVDNLWAAKQTHLAHPPVIDDTT